MIIVKKEGTGWNLLNLLGVAIVLYFTWYALNRWVAPFNQPK